MLNKTSNISCTYPALVLVTVFCDVCILFKMGLGLQSSVKVISDAVILGYGQYHVLSKLLPWCTACAVFTCATSSLSTKAILLKTTMRIHCRRCLRSPKLTSYTCTAFLPVLRIQHMSRCLSPVHGRGVWTGIGRSCWGCLNTGRKIGDPRTR